MAWVGYLRRKGLCSQGHDRVLRLTPAAEAGA